MAEPTTSNEQPRILTIAADIIAKCIAKGTVGALYVPVDVCKRAWPTHEHPLVLRAVTELDSRGFLQWHKQRTCFGLEPTNYAHAYRFALENASPKRREVLRHRFIRSGDDEVVSIADWEGDDEPGNLTRSDVLTMLEDYVPRNLFDVRLRDLRVDIANGTKQTITVAAPRNDGPTTEDLNAIYNRIRDLRSLLDKYLPLLRELETDFPAMREAMLGHKEALEKTIEEVGRLVRDRELATNRKEGLVQCKTCHSLDTTDVEVYQWDASDGTVDKRGTKLPFCEPCRGRQPAVALIPDHRGQWQRFLDATADTMKRDGISGNVAFIHRKTAVGEAFIGFVQDRLLRGLMPGHLRDHKGVGVRNLNS